MYPPTKEEEEAAETENKPRRGLGQTGIAILMGRNQSGVEPIQQPGRSQHGERLADPSATFWRQRQVDAPLGAVGEEHGRHRPPAEFVGRVKGGDLAGPARELACTLLTFFSPAA